jgi:type II secretion system protein N
MTDMTDHGPLTVDGIPGDDAPGFQGQAAPETPPTPPMSRARQIATQVGWVAFGAGCLLLFTLLKLPEDRIKNYAQGMIAAQLAPKGITFTAERGYVSVGWGLSYVMKNVTLILPGPDAPAKIDKLSVSPSILPLIFGYQGGTIWAYQGDGTLSASFSMKGTQFSGSFKAKGVDLGKLGVLPITAGIRGSAVATGSGSFSGDLAAPSTLGGEAELDLGKVVLEPQSIMGFSVPRIQLSEGKISLNADKGKATIRAFKLGKAGSADDIQANASGDVLLGRNWESSTLNAKINFKLSENILKSFVFIDALLSAGKQGDGSYTFSLTGSLTAPQFLPVK